MCRLLPPFLYSFIPLSDDVIGLTCVDIIHLCADVMSFHDDDDDDYYYVDVNNDRAIQA